MDAHDIAYVTARLAPDRSVQRALALGGIGVLLCGTRAASERTLYGSPLAVWKQQYPYQYAWLDRDHVVNGDPAEHAPPRHRLGDGPAGSAGRVDQRCDPPAWIPVGPSVDDDPAAFTLPPLTVLHERISPVAARRGVTVERGEDPPAALAGADLAIVGAHGGLVPGEGYFQVVSNDRTQRWSGEHVSHSLRCIGILVLFVCSAGRIETYRRYRTSGFVKRLLASECRAIVASPWPVSVTAAAHRLPTSLDVLASGQTVGSAAHEANRHVLDRLGGDAGEGLAMHVFGDPLQR